jgi:hypothetical protein
VQDDGELAALDSLIARVSDHGPSFVVVIGPAGIGKTGLLAAVDQRARSGGLGVLRAAGADLERGFAFGGAVQLFEARLRAATDQQRRGLLEGAARFGGALLGFGAAEPTRSPANSAESCARQAPSPDATS